MAIGTPIRSEPHELHWDRAEDTETLERFFFVPGHEDAILKSLPSFSAAAGDQQERRSCGSASCSPCYCLGGTWPRRHGCSSKDAAGAHLGPQRACRFVAFVVWLQTVAEMPTAQCRRSHRRWWWVRQKTPRARIDTSGRWQESLFYFTKSWAMT
jgi:hypothetical protein